jgi:hypothetical protein
MAGEFGKLNYQVKINGLVQMIGENVIKPILKLGLCF